MKRLILIFFCLMLTNTAFAEKLTPRRVGAFFDWSAEKNLDSDIFSNREINFPEVLTMRDGRLVLATIYKDAEISRLRLTSLNDMLLHKTRRLFDNDRMLFPKPEKTSRPSFISFNSAAPQSSVRASYGHGIYRVQGPLAQIGCNSSASLIVLRAQQGKITVKSLSCNKAWPIAVPLDGKSRSSYLLADEKLIQRNRLNQQGQFAPGRQATLKSWIPDASTIIAMDVNSSQDKPLTIVVIYSNARNKYILCRSQWDIRKQALPSHEKTPCQSIKVSNPIAVRLNDKGSLLAVAERDVKNKINRLKIFELAGNNKTPRLIDNDQLRSFPVAISEIKGQSYINFQSMHWLGDQFYWVNNSADGSRRVMQYDRNTNRLRTFSLEPDRCTSVAYYSPNDTVEGSLFKKPQSSKNPRSLSIAGSCKSFDCLNDAPVQMDEDALKKALTHWQQILGKRSIKNIKTGEELRLFLQKENIFLNKTAWLPVDCTPPSPENQSHSTSLRKALEFININWVFPFKHGERTYIAASIVTRVQAKSLQQEKKTSPPVVRMSILEVVQ